MWPFNRKQSDGMKIARTDNRWTEGSVHLVLPPLAPHAIGAEGARFMELEFQRACGPEIFLCIYEESPWAQQYGEIRALTLFVSSLAVNTNVGPVGILLWRLSQGADVVVRYEHYIDPLSEPTLRLLARIESQSRLKVIMRDSSSGKTAGFWEFDNNFEMGKSADNLGRAVAGMAAGAFSERVQLAQQEYGMEDLIALTERGEA